MNRAKIRCQWCPNLPTSLEVYSTFVETVHGEMNPISTGQQKWCFSEINNVGTSGLELDSDLDKPWSQV